MAVIDEMFYAFFFGSGRILGASIMLLLMGSFTYKMRYMGILMIPIAVLLGLEYVTLNLSWYAFLMFFGAIFMLLIMYKGNKK